MDCWKDLAEFVQAIVTTTAILIAGWWTYYRFVRNRLRFPRVALDIVVHDTPLPDDCRLVHVEIKIENTGSVMLKPMYSEIRLRQVVPIQNGINLAVPPDKQEIEWPCIAQRNWQFAKGDFEIEPGEKDSLHADFIISSGIMLAEFYFYLSNAKKSRKDLGWPLTTLYEFDHNEEEEAMCKSESRESISKQQRQQKPQQPQQSQQSQQPQQIQQQGNQQQGTKPAKKK